MPGIFLKYHRKKKGTSMKNRIVIDSPKIADHTIAYSYCVEGEWAEVFRAGETFFIDYSCDLSSVPEGVAVIPLLGNLLPVAWIYDAEIVVPVCDRDFYESIPAFREGYVAMYPAMAFGGKITVGNVQDNPAGNSSKAGAFFSGGVDAHNTLIRHAEEKPVLLTLWGSDVWLWDTAGWENVQTHLAQTAREFDVDFITIKTRFRSFLNEEKLCARVAASGDNWWHGFQHGLGIITHAAPVACSLGLTKLFFASTYSPAEKGRLTCASDPTIDNFIRFCGVQVVHDGYEHNRQQKVHHITQYAKNTERKIALRVCWESAGGNNCCHCEKCWRTILAIYAEGFDPRDFGFNYPFFPALCQTIHVNVALLKVHRDTWYPPIQAALRKNYSILQIPKELRWFYRIRMDRLGEVTLREKAVRKAKDVLRKVRNRLLRR